MPPFNLIFNDFDKVRKIREKRQFMALGAAGQIKVTDFVPATGLGRFDATYDPNANRLDVRVKCSFDFIQKPGTLAWDQQAQDDFRDMTEQKVEAFWKERYRIRCTKEGWDELYADVFVNLDEVPNGESYIIRVERIGAYKSSGGIDHNSFPHICGVNNFANDIDTTKKVNQLFNYKEGLLRETLRAGTSDGFGDYFAFDTNSTKLSSDVTWRLSLFATYAKRRIDYDLADVKGFVVGFTSQADSSFKKLKGSRARAIADWLNNLMGRPNNNPFAIVVSPSDATVADAVRLLRLRTPNQNGSNTPSGGSGGALIVISTAAGVGRDARSNYVVMHHEFGHMLGLPDEYMGIQHRVTLAKAKLSSVFPATYFGQTVVTGADRVAKMQKRFTRQTELANVQLPNYMSNTGEANSEAAANFLERRDIWYAARDAYGAKVGKTSDKYRRWKQAHPEPQPPLNQETISSSIMHSGDEVLPCHYVTIWSALCRATQGYVDPQEWSISLHPNNPSAIRYF
jgi:hypothetical protein